MLKSFKDSAYDEDTGFGLLRHVLLVQRGFATSSSYGGAGDSVAQSFRQE